MAATVNVNGEIHGGHNAVISVFDHGFLFGEGVYETLRTYNRKPFLFDRHMRRLRNSASMIRLQVPIEDDEFLDRICRTMGAAALPDEAYIRVLLTRGPGELTYNPEACPTPSIVIIVKPHVPPPPEVFERGVKVAFVSILRNHPGSVNPLIKSNNLLNNALAMQEALQQDAFEALMLNYRGDVAECSQSNFFIVRNGEALTPPLDAGLLQGITRDFLLEIGPEIGVPVRETALGKDDVFAADEAFLTSTTREATPIVQVDDRPIGTGRPGPVTRQLLEGLRRRAEELTR